MRLSLVRNGPVAVGFEVYDDFMHYTTGVYHHTFTLDRVNKLAFLLNPENRLSAGDLKKWDPFQVKRKYF